MKVLVTGGRGFSNRTLLFASLDSLHADHAFTMIIHGGASGADRLAGEWAASRCIPVEVHPAGWQRYGRAAGPIRNQRMIDRKPDMVVAFPGGRGTADMVRRVRQAGIELVVVEQ
jgi:phosphoribosylformylglycinamidine (FGAM) synthase-like amidotransferase family enzyme